MLNRIIGAYIFVFFLLRLSTALIIYLIKRYNENDLYKYQFLANIILWN